MSKKTIKVAVGIVRNAEGKILLSQRKPGVLLAGKWEFPGGKLEENETELAGLKRELSEELGIKVKNAKKIIEISHSYPEFKVKLKVYEVRSFSGKIEAKEDQNLRWTLAYELSDLDILSSDRPIISALNLPDRYMITPQGKSIEELITLINHAVVKFKITLVQYRDNVTEDIFKIKAQQLIKLARELNIKLLLNSNIELAKQLKADGVHLNSRRLMVLENFINPHNFILGASCHNLPELKKAAKINANFAVLSQVLPSSSHPENPGFGWKEFSKLVKKSNIPTYALGGVGIENITRARESGAQGIAGISCFKD